MDSQKPRFVVVIHPGTNNPSAIIRALQIDKAIALHVMSYSEWLACMPITEHILLCIQEDGQWVYAENPAEKEALRKKIAAL